MLLILYTLEPVDDGFCIFLLIHIEFMSKFFVHCSYNNNNNNKNNNNNSRNNEKVNRGNNNTTTTNNNNSKINYIHRESNHPPSIIKQLPLSVESRLSKLSSDENVFVQAASIYQEPLKRAGYNHKLNYNNKNNNDNNPRTGKQWKRNIIWFNPPFSTNVTTKIGRYFLNLVDKHSPRDHKFHKILNRSNIKVS